MPKARLTTLSVERLKPPASGRVEHWDQTLPGFGLRVSATGSKAWVLMYRIGRRQRRQTLGKFPAMDLAKARQKARAALDQVDRGQDPGARRARLKAASAETFDGAADLFLERYARTRQRNPARTEYLLDRYVRPDWGPRRLESIARGDVALLVDRIAEAGAPVMANRILTVVKKLFTWAVERDLIDASPAAGVAAPGREVSRDRTLNSDELTAVWNACEVLGYPFGALVRLLILTGQRRDEVARIAWPDIVDRTWTLPREITKSGRAHVVPLSGLAMQTLATVPQFDGVALLFPSRRGNDRPVSGFSKAKRQLDKASGVTGWRLHDLRRTVATGMAQLNVPPHVVEAILNHRSGTIRGVAAVYNRYDYAAEKASALETWAGRISGLFTDKVVVLHG